MLRDYPSATAAHCEEKRFDDCCKNLEDIQAVRGPYLYEAQMVRNGRTDLVLEKRNLLRPSVET